MFITFEGGEGAGKSTQIQFLSKFLIQKGISHITTREPGGTEGGRLIRNLLIDPTMPDWDAMTEYMLLLADRRYHIESKIKPAMQLGEWVISDRFQDSSVVYQGWGKGLNLESLSRIYKEVIGDFYPDTTFILDLPIQVSQERVQKRGGQIDRFEREKQDFHEKIRQGYLAIAQQYPERCRIIDATQSPENIAQDILQSLNLV